MKRFGLILACLCIAAAPAHHPLDKVWSSRPLVWEDFRGMPDTESNSVASIRCELVMEDPVDSNGHVYVDVKAMFRGALSWTRTDMPLVLNHEQRHFDITELYARRLRKKLATHRLSSSAMYRQLHRLLKRELKAMTSCQDTYDEVTNHSMKLKSQQRWDSLVVHELRQLEAWSKPRIELQLK